MVPARSNAAIETPLTNRDQPNLIVYSGGNRERKFCALAMLDNSKLGLKYP